MKVERAIGLRGRIKEKIGKATKKEKENNPFAIDVGGGGYLKGARYFRIVSDWVHFRFYGKRKPRRNDT
jgi:hypothetical protein